MANETGLDETKVDETAVDKIAVDEPGPHPLYKRDRLLQMTPIVSHPPLILTRVYHAI